MSVDYLMVTRATIGIRGLKLAKITCSLAMLAIYLASIEVYCTRHQKSCLLPENLFHSNLYFNLMYHLKHWQLCFLCA